jgi:hypothetical protein
VASVSDAEPDLRALARRIPDDIRQSLSKLEMHLRLTDVAGILADAELAGAGRKADRLRQKAGLILKADSPGTYAITVAALEGELSQASLDGDHARARQITQAIRRYEIRHPQPSLEVIVSAAKAAVARLKIPPCEPRSSLVRRFNPKRRRK